MAEQVDYSKLIHRSAQSAFANDGENPLLSGDVAHYIASLAAHFNTTQTATTFAINICADRLHFIRTFYAIIEAGHTNLLPPNKQPTTLKELRTEYENCYLIHDGLSPSLGFLSESVNTIDIRDFHAAYSESENGHADLPKPKTEEAVSPDHLAAMCFTSGSSGESTAIKKTWQVIAEGNQINARNMLVSAPDGLQLLATVPPQHMYGLELSVMLPSIADVCVHNGQPLLPGDVNKALRQMPSPRALVSTPAHLKALVESGLEFPEVCRIYSATAPLFKDLAQSVETLFGGEIVEIYGCSEIGSIARRRSSVSDSWTPFDAMLFSHDQTSGISHVSAPHVSEPVELQDRLEPTTDNTFTLHGRLGDMINIAGIRGSLGDVNKRLMSIDGVKDGVVFMPDASDKHTAKVQRLCAIVCSDTLDRRSLSAALKQHVHPAFMPRPILFTDSLPRNEASKLPRAALMALYQTLTLR